MEVKKYDKIILDSTRSIDDIVASIKAELSKQESENAGESYICYVSHAYSSGDNAGVNYIVVSDEFKNLNGLSSNVIKASSYTKDEINELIARVDAKIPVDEAKLAKQNELKSVEADILGKEQSIPRKRQELLTLNEQKRTLEANLATITELINEKEQAGENTEILQAQKRQYESDIATKSSQITNLESEINQLNSDIEVLNQTKERLKREEALIQSPELATKEYVDNLKANLDSKSSELNSRIDSVNSDLTNIIDTKANADAVVNLTSDQTIEGVKTFSMVPIVATQPTDDNQLANKAYVDSRAASSGSGDATKASWGVNWNAGIKLPNDVEMVAPNDGVLFLFGKRFGYSGSGDWVNDEWFQFLPKVYTGGEQPIRGIFPTDLGSDAAQSIGQDPMFSFFQYPKVSGESFEASRDYAPVLTFIPVRQGDRLWLYTSKQRTNSHGRPYELLQAAFFPFEK